MTNLDQTFRICPLSTTNIIFYVQLDPILQVSSQEPSTSFKSLCKQRLILSRSLAELSLSKNIINFEWIFKEKKWELFINCFLSHSDSFLEFDKIKIYEGLRFYFLQCSVGGVTIFWKYGIHIVCHPIYTMLESPCGSWEGSINCTKTQMAKFGAILR